MRPNGEVIEIKLRDQPRGFIYYKDCCNINDFKRLKQILKAIEDKMGIDFNKVLKENHDKMVYKENDWF